MVSIHVLYSSSLQSSTGVLQHCGLLLAMGFCRAKFWAKFPFWKGAVRGEVFREVCREVFHEVFGLVLLGHSEQNNFSKNFSPKFPWPCTAKLEKFQGKNFMTRFCRGTLAKVAAVWISSGEAWPQLSEPSHHYFSKKYRDTPPICIAIRRQFLLEYFWCQDSPEAARNGPSWTEPDPERTEMDRIGHFSSSLGWDGGSLLREKERKSGFWGLKPLRKGEDCQYSSHLYRSTPPICIAARLPFVSQCFWENLGGRGHRDVPQTVCRCLPVLDLCHDLRINFPPPTPKSAVFTSWTWFRKKSPY